MRLSFSFQHVTIVGESSQVSATSSSCALTGIHLVHESLITCQRVDCWAIYQDKNATGIKKRCSHDVS
jgi:hypothetical protein